MKEMKTWNGYEVVDEKARNTIESEIRRLENKISVQTMDARIERNTKRIENLEQGITPSPFVTDSTVAYTKDVPENALPYAEVQKLGGMTRKCTNLLNMSKFSGGSKVINSDGSVSITSVDYAIYPSAILTGVLPTGTYNLSNISGNSCYVMLSTSDYSNLVGIGQNKSFTYDGSSYLEIRYLEQAANTTVTYTAMLNTGSTALPYEPYFEGLRSAPVTSVESVGANLLPFPYAHSTKTVAGVTWTVHDDGRISVSGTATGYSAITLLSGLNIKDIGDVYFYLNGSFSSLVAVVTLYDSAGNILKQREDNVGIRMDISSYPTAATLNIYLKRTENTEITGDFYPMLSKSLTALPYAPYTKSTLPIPEAVQALDGYGEGVSESVYNYITWNPEGNVKTYTKAVGAVDMGTLNWEKFFAYEHCFMSDGVVGRKPGITHLLAVGYENKYSLTDDKSIFGNSSDGDIIYVVDERYTDAATFKAAMSGVMLYYELATPEVTDISELITSDNLIPVEGNGTITFANEYGYAVPSTVEYMTTT